MNVGKGNGLKETHDKTQDRICYCLLFSAGAEMSGGGRDVS